MILRNWRSMRRLLLDGDIGLAEAYRDGDLHTPDLTALIELGARNDATLRQLVSGTWPARLLNRTRHLLNANTRKGSRRNITAHYDLGNDFYSRWLDESMMYSSALYADPSETLEAAQQRRLDRIVEMLGVSGGEHVLEIGCGWGALAERLAREGCRVTAVTLSPAQLEAAQKRIDAAGLSGQVELRLQDYRDITGTFDRIVSIEMIEAVGRAYWPSYIATLARSLKPGGGWCCQAITIEDAIFESYQQGPTSSSATSSRRLPAFRAGAASRGRRGRLCGRRGALLRRELCRHAEGVAPPLPGALARDRPARLRRGVPAAVGVLSLLLRGGLPRQDDRCRADRPAPRLTDRPPGAANGAGPARARRRWRLPAPERACGGHRGEPGFHGRGEAADQADARHVAVEQCPNHRVDHRRGVLHDRPRMGVAEIGVAQHQRSQRRVVGGMGLVHPGHHLEGIAAEAGEHVAVEAGGGLAPVMSPSGHADRGEAEIGAAALVADRKAVAADAQLRAGQPGEPDGAGADDDDAAIVAGMGPETGAEPSLSNTARAKGLRQAARLSRAPLRPMPARQMPACTRPRSASARPASSSAPRVACITAPSELSCPSRSEAGPAMPEPSTSPSAVSSRQRQPVPPPSTPIKRRGAHACTRSMSAPQRFSLRSSAS